MMIQRLPFLLIAASFACAADAPPLVAAGSAKAAAAETKPMPAATPPQKVEPGWTDEDFYLQGEFVGTMRDNPFAMQVICLGKGNFDAVMRPGGLPGGGSKRQASAPQRVSGKRDGAGAGASVRFSANGWSAVLKGDEVQLLDFKGPNIGTLARVRRESPTLGMAPPAGAVVLFDGKDVKAFQKGARMTTDGLLMEGATTVQEFGDCTLHVEFQLSYMPEQRGQSRSNSGVYLQGRYEVQILDSFGLNGENNECGGIYTIAKPMVNMCLPPQVWQTYDIDFDAPSFDAAGKKTEEAHITVKHNGVLIHDGVTVPHATPSALFPAEAAKGPLHLQNHKNPVRFRNLWIIPK
ncbi:MAG: hypothetical protein JWO89_2866 [Verrucomicrobiaceae bacterium]|nr:hypothetical protein [Verrucomicrobiaceae bacterium]